MSEFKIRKLDDDFEILPSYGPRHAGIWVDKDTLELNTNPDGTRRRYLPTVVAPVAAGSALTLTAATHANRTIALDTAAGSTITLPAATGSGVRFRLVTSVKPTSNQHRINVVGNDSFKGQAFLTDEDATAVVSYITAADTDRINLNGTTSGGQVGDIVEVEDIAADTWALVAFLRCAAGSNVATPLATGQVS